jgi:type II restriction/modification system DNA methylase subunit YeeA
MLGELGDEYVGSLRSLYAGRVPSQADLVCYWFDRALQAVLERSADRAGLLATNSIRGGANRHVLDTIKGQGDIFLAWSDRKWVLDGAAIRVSVVGFDGGEETCRLLDGEVVPAITSDLRADLDLTSVRRLRENSGASFIGDTKKGKFDIDPVEAADLLGAPLNPNGRPNSDVLRPWMNGLDVVRRRRGRWIIDFGAEMSESEAALYEGPFELVRQRVKPERDKVRSQLERRHWWLHARPALDARIALSRVRRYIATPRVAKHRVFAWLEHPTLPDCQLVVVARDDDYFFGVLHSKPHELWSLRMCTWLGVGNDPRYTPSTTFETFPFPWPPGKEPTGDPRVEAIAEAARELVAKRDAWLNPEGAAEAELKKRTLTALYNARPTWLDLAHKKLDAAVFAAYGWDDNPADEEILARLLALNRERASQ